MGHEIDDNTREKGYIPGRCFCTCNNLVCNINEAFLLDNLKYLTVKMQIGKAINGILPLPITIF